MIFLDLTNLRIALASLCQVHWLRIIMVHAEHIVVICYRRCSLHIFAILSKLCDRSLWT